ncbi:MAG: hypothetical protein RL136_1547 [Planctomycetota bacterium]
MRVSYHPDYVVPLPEGHAFPMRKYALLHDRLVEERLLSPTEVSRPEEADWEVLRLVHEAGYLDRLRHGALSASEERRIGMPWSPALVRRSRLAVQGTIDAAIAAIETPERIAANLAGGTHHALADMGEGYCMLNDVAIATRWLRQEGEVGRVLVCDLDVHHGNGTAAIFADDPATFTFSMHGARNFPMRKPPSTLDVPLDDGCGDAEYLALLAQHLPAILDRFRPDLVFYLAGVDVVAGDRFGRLGLTEPGLTSRDRFVIETVAAQSTPLCLLLAGGYARTPERTAELHAHAHREARRWLRSRGFA